jgi:hypothetical protein
MRRIATSLLLLAATAGGMAQGTDRQATEERMARIRELVSQDSGDITALEPSTLGNGSVLIGYSSGTVVRCDPAQICDELTGTPNIAVQGIAASKQSASEVVWVSYGQGALYQCVDRQCAKVVRDAR